MSEHADEVADGDSMDQLQADDTLIDRGVDDVLDEGYTAPDRWSVAQGFGNTPAEQRQGETLDQRIAQEQPEDQSTEIPEPWNPTGEMRQVGTERAGRLVDANGGVDGEDTESEAIGHAVGIDGGAASAEEAAMHVINEDDLTGEDDYDRRITTRASANTPTSGER